MNFQYSNKGFSKHSFHRKCLTSIFDWFILFQNKRIWRFYCKYVLIDLRWTVENTSQIIPQAVLSVTTYLFSKEQDNKEKILLSSLTRACRKQKRATYNTLHSRLWWQKMSKWYVCSNWKLQDRWYVHW
jgi:hypothetical protein